MPSAEHYPSTGGNGQGLARHIHATAAWLGLAGVAVHIAAPRWRRAQQGFGWPHAAVPRSAGWRKALGAVLAAALAMTTAAMLDVTPWPADSWQTAGLFMTGLARSTDVEAMAALD